MSVVDFSMLQVLVVNDQKSMRSIIRDLLKQAGIDKVEEAVNGDEALKWLRNPRADDPDVIITDLYMDGMDGMELCNQIRTNEKLRGRATPIIILTDEEDEMMHEVGLQLGAASVLTKPVNAAELLAEIQTVIGFSTDF
ncbi:MAG: response regulator transcription factor [Pseudomonadota bacterium]|nr:response regulator transcription factor [Pseudomonadota bacterium]